MTENPDYEFPGSVFGIRDREKVRVLKLLNTIWRYVYQI